MKTLVRIKEVLSLIRDIRLCTLKYEWLKWYMFLDDKSFEDLEKLRYLALSGQLN